MDLIDRLKIFIKSQSIGQTKFEEIVGFSRGYISNIKTSIGADKLGQIKSKYPTLDIDWLITGEGEMLKNTGTMTGSNQGDGNKIEYKNGGNVGVGNTVNVTLPEIGTQKIIKPDSTVEVTLIEPNDIASDKLERENEALKAKISHLMDNIQLKDDLIASLRDTIELLKHRQ